MGESHGGVRRKSKILNVSLTKVEKISTLDEFFVDEERKVKWKSAFKYPTHGSSIVYTLSGFQGQNF